MQKYLEKKKFTIMLKRTLSKMKKSKRVKLNRFLKQKVGRKIIIRRIIEKKIWKKVKKWN